MRYTNLGKRGPKVSVIGLGLWQAGSPSWGTSADSSLIREIVNGVREAVGLGINFFDTAEIYGWGYSERILGEALRSLEREMPDLVIATKVGGFRVTRKQIIKAAESSRRRLGIRSIGLLQLHWPPPAWIPLCNVIKSLEHAVKIGIAEYYGLSNFPEKLQARALACAKSIEPVSNQIQYNLAYRAPEQALIGEAVELGLGIIAWSPLAKGALAGVTSPRTKAQRGDPVFREAASNSKLQETLSRISEAHGVSRAQIALAWLISKGAIPIPGFRRSNRVKEYAASAKIELSEDDIKLLDSITKEYIHKWGKGYSLLKYLRYTPCWLQYLVLRLSGGI